MRGPDGLVDRATAGELADLLARIAAGSLSRPNAKEVLAEHLETGASVATIVDRRGLRQISDTSALDALIDEVLAANPSAVADVAAGRPQAIGFLVGQVMKASKGQANAALVQTAIRSRVAGTG